MKNLFKKSVKLQFLYSVHVCSFMLCEIFQKFYSLVKSCTGGHTPSEASYSCVLEVRDAEDICGNDGDRV